MNVGDAWERQVLELAKLYNWRVAAFRSVRISEGGRTYYATPIKADGKGWPDLVLVKGHQILFRELKAGKHSRLTPEQKQWICDLRDAGQDAEVWHSSEIDEVISQLASTGRHIPEDQSPQPYPRRGS